MITKMPAKVAIDFTINFNALLEEAKAQYKAYTGIVDPLRTEYNTETMCFPPEIQAKIDAAFNKWQDWCKKNINSRGLELNCNMLGEPIGISACLVGRCR